MSIPVPDWVSLVATIALVVAVVRVARFAERRVAIRRDATDLVLGAGSDLVVVDDPIPRAFAVFGTAPRVIVTSGMLRALEPLERRVLLAHERAHLEHHHNRYQLLMRVASALNPVVGVATRHLTFALERWADEDAAAVVADRSAVASSLAHAAFLTTGTSGPSSSLAYASLGVADRVAALRGDRPPRRRLLGLGAFLVVVTPATVAVLDATLSLARMLDVGAIIHR